MIKRSLLQAILLCFAVLLQAQDKPNIVFILADDLGYGDLSCYGHPYAKTPALDQLASEGLRFTQFHVTGTTCNPSRTGFMTSRHPASYHKYAADYGFGNVPTVTELLNKNGYTTGHFGKWHIGRDQEAVDGIYGIDKVGVIGVNKSSEGGRDVDLFEEATNFIEQNKDKPFYVNIWGHISHYAIDPVASLVAEFNDVQVKRSDFGVHQQSEFDDCEWLGGNIEQSMRNYLGDVYSLDMQVGRLMKKLDELGLRENTIVIFSSDQGPAPVIVASHQASGQWDIIGENTGVMPSQNMLGYAGGLRGRKHTQFEGGVRSPLIIRWPGNVPVNKVDSTSILSALDYLPTLCGIADIPIDSTKFEGNNVVDIWKGTATGKHRSTPLFWRPSSVNGDASMLDGNWKMHEDKGSYTLYDLSVDEKELNDVSNVYPEKVAELKKKMDAWVATLPNTYLKGYDPDSAYKKEYPIDTSFKAQALVHLDASIDSLVITDANKTVTVWKDRSGNNYHAEPAAGNALYPSSKTFDNGLNGIDLRGSRVSLELMTAQESDVILNQAANPTGFCVITAVYVESIIEKQNDILGNSSSVNNGFLMRHTDGKLQASLGEPKASGDKVITAGQLAVFAFNYSAASGVFEYFCSATGEVLAGNVSAADFSNNSALTIGATNSSNRYFEGMVGEVIIYNTDVPRGNLDKMIEELEQKWEDENTMTDKQKPSKPTVLQASPISTSQIDLNWNPSSDNIKVAGYSVFRNGNKIAEVSETHFSDTGLNAGTSYDYFVVAFDDAKNESEASGTITASTIAVGIEVLGNSSNQALVYPNPVTSSLFISLPNSNDSEICFELYSINGSLIKSEKFQTSNKITRYSIDLTNQRNGFYIYRLKGSKTNISGLINVDIDQ